MSERVGRDRTSLAEKIDRLFERAQRREGRELSYQEVARRIEQETGVKISPSYLWELRNGVSDNPRRAHLEALANYFDISPAYFYEDERPNIPEDFPVYAEFAEKLDYLIRNVFPSGRGPYTEEEVAAGTDTSPEHIAALRRGEETQPSMDIAGRIARLFKVPAGIFFDAEVARDVAEEIRVFLLLRDSDMRAIATRIAETTPERRKHLLRVIEAMVSSWQPEEGGERPDEGGSSTDRNG